MESKEPKVHEYVFHKGVIPSNRTNHNAWHGHARDGTTTREVFMRDGVWVIRWTFTPTGSKP